MVEAGMVLDDGTPVQARNVPCNGVALHVVEAGPVDGPPVILLHGFPEFWRGWRHQIGPLARAGFRVIVPDQRGYDLSDKPEGVRPYRIDRLAGDITALADACGVGSFGLVGHDWGGIVAFWLAARHPERVRRLAILNAPHPDAIGPYMRRHPTQVARSLYAVFFQIPGLPERLLSARDYAALTRALTGSARRGAFTAEDLARYRAAWSEPGAVTAMLNWYRALMQTKRPPAGRVTAPTLMIWGERDVALSRGFAKASLDLCDEADVLWRPQATHWVQHEEPEVVNAALIAHLSS
jgi:pimeloyl-ACP methyl ester carboxylesterase